MVEQATKVGRVDMNSVGTESFYATARELARNRSSVNPDTLVSVLELPFRAALDDEYGQSWGEVVENPLYALPDHFGPAGQDYPRFKTFMESGAHWEGEVTKNNCPEGVYRWEDGDKYLRLITVAKMAGICATMDARTFHRPLEKLTAYGSEFLAVVKLMCFGSTDPKSGTGKYVQVLRDITQSHTTAWQEYEERNWDHQKAHYIISKVAQVAARLSEEDIRKWTLAKGNFVAKKTESVAKAYERYMEIRSALQALKADECEEDQWNHQFMYHLRLAKPLVEPGLNALKARLESKGTEATFRALLDQYSREQQTSEEETDSDGSGDRASKAPNNKRKRKSQGGEQQKKAKIRCFSCNSTDHIAANCDAPLKDRKKKACYKCGNESHLAAACTASEEKRKEFRAGQKKEKKAKSAAIRGKQSNASLEKKMVRFAEDLEELKREKTAANKIPTLLAALKAEILSKSSGVEKLMQQEELKKFAEAVNVDME